jgi:hypothetical protein
VFPIIAVVGWKISLERLVEHIGQSFYVPVLLQLFVGVIRDRLNNHERHNFRMPGNVYERGAVREKGKGY